MSANIDFQLYDLATGRLHQSHRSVGHIDQVEAQCGGDPNVSWVFGHWDASRTFVDGNGVVQPLPENEWGPPPAPPEPPEPPAPPVVRVPTIYAVAQLVIADGEISNIDINSRFSAALWLDVGNYLVFFDETQPDTSYLAKAYDDAGSRARVTEKTVDYIAITVTAEAGAPVDPAELSIEIIRVS